MKPTAARSPPSLVALIESRVARGDVPPNISPDAHPYSPSLYSRMDVSDPYKSPFELDPLVTPLSDAWNESQYSVDEVQGARHPFAEPLAGPEVEPEEADHRSRLSVMGPKMNFLSRAPWDEADDIPEEEEAYDDNSDTVSTYSRKKPRDRGRTITKGVDEHKPWISFTRARPKDLSLKDMISTPVPISGLGEPPSPPIFHKAGSHPSSIRSRFTGSAAHNGRTDSQLSSDTTASSVSAHIPSLPSPRSATHPKSSSVSSTSSGFHGSPDQHPGSPSSMQFDTSDSTEEEVHPYANPEVYHSASSQYTFPGSPSNPFLLADCDPPSCLRSESIATIKTDSTELARLPMSTHLQSSSSRTIPFPSTQSVPPLNLPHMKERSDGSGMHTFPGSATYNLISLERAQERARTKSTTSGLPKKSNDKSTITTFRKALSQTSLSTQLSSASLATPSTPTSNKFRKDDAAESPPLPPLPADPVHGVGKVLKPKRSGFLKIFDRDRNKDRMGENFEPVAVPGRSISSLADMGIGEGDHPFGSTNDHLPPLPPIPLQYRQESKQDRALSLQTHSSSAGETQIDFRRRPSASADIAPSSSPAKAEQRAAKNTKGKKQTQPLKFVVDHPNAGNRDRIEFQSLEVRPMSSLFSTMDFGLPIEEGDRVSSDSPKGSKTTSAFSGSGFRRRPEGLYIGIPNPNLDPSLDFYSPLTASSLSSTFSRSVATESTLGGPMTPHSGNIPRSSSASLNTSGSVSAPPLSTFSSLLKSYASSSTPPASVAKMQTLQDQLLSEQNLLVQERKKWQLQKWEYEAQIRDLENDLAECRLKPCRECGTVPSSKGVGVGATGGDTAKGIINRPRTISNATSTY